MALSGDARAESPGQLEQEAPVLTLEQATRLLTSHDAQYVVGHALGMVAGWDPNKTRTRRAMDFDDALLETRKEFVHADVGWSTRTARASKEASMSQSRSRTMYAMGSGAKPKHRRGTAKLRGQSAAPVPPARSRYACHASASSVSVFWDKPSTITITRPAEQCSTRARMP